MRMLRAGVHSFGSKAEIRSESYGQSLPVAQDTLPGGGGWVRGICGRPPFWTNQSVRRDEPAGCDTFRPPTDRPACAHGFALHSS